MVKKKNTRTKRKSRGGPIFVSPDGGQTVYEQKKNGGWGKCIYQSEQAKLMEQAQEELGMMGTEAIRMRQKYPALQKAWDQYRMIWNVTAKEEYED